MSIINCVGKRIKRTVALLIAATLLYSLTGCAKGPTGNNNLSSDIDSNNADETEFDIGRVRKSFIIKGCPLNCQRELAIWMMRGHTKSVKRIMLTIQDWLISILTEKKCL